MRDIRGISSHADIEKAVLDHLDEQWGHAIEDLRRDPRRQWRTILERAPVVSTDPVMEAIARELSGIAAVPPAEQARMIRRAAKAGKEALLAEQATIAEVAGGSLT